MAEENCKDIDPRLDPDSAAFDWDFFHRYQTQQFEREKAARLEQRDWSGYIWMCNRPERLAAFKRIQQDLSDCEYWELLSEVWQDTETIFREQRDWLALLRNPARWASREHFMQPDDAAKLAALPNRITVYRGYRSEVGNRNGLSWTLDRKIARKLGSRVWMAIPNDKPLYKAGIGKIAQRTINKSEIFAYLNGRSEHEVILLPGHAQKTKSAAAGKTR